MADPIPNARFVPASVPEPAPAHRGGYRAGLIVGWGCMAVGFGLALVLAVSIAVAALRWAFGG